MSMKDPGSIVILQCLWGMVVTMVIMVCIRMVLMLFREHVNFILRRTKKVLLSNGVHGAIPVFQISINILKNKVALYV